MKPTIYTAVASPDLMHPGRLFNPSCSQFSCATSVNMKEERPHLKDLQGADWWLHLNRGSCMFRQNNNHAFKHTLSDITHPLAPYAWCRYSCIVCVAIACSSTLLQRMTNTTYSPGEKAHPLKQHGRLAGKLAWYWSEKSVKGGKLNR